MTTMSDTPPPPHPAEPHRSGLGTRLNALRAGVLGAQDGIVSTAGMVVGVSGATAERGAVLVAGVAALVAGALSMAGGEYASVSAQRDSERSTLARERWELANMPEDELDELTDLYARKGLDRALARDVAVALTERDALAAHAEVELGLDPHARVSPWVAALTSALAFTLGALLPLLAVLLAPDSSRVAWTVVVVVLALCGTGWLSARLGGTHPLRPVLRVLAVGLLAMGVTYAIGAAIGVAL